MNRCPSCDYPLPPDRERIGARCPNCRDPLYEPPGRTSRPARADEGACALHSGRETVGTCGRCGNYFCEVCRTRWRDQILCVACADRVLTSREATPEQARAHFRQALWGLLMGLATWLALLLTVFLMNVAAAAHALVLALLAFPIFISAVVLGVLGSGQAIAALRTRGPHLIMAVAGLILSALSLGVFIGIWVFALWTS
jgi:hypothetical protein